MLRLYQIINGVNDHADVPVSKCLRTQIYRLSMSVPAVAQPAYGSSAGGVNRYTEDGIVVFQWLLL